MVKSALIGKTKRSKAKKSKKKDSFINDSSEEDIFSEEEYLPVIKTRTACRKMPKITPVKKSVYCLNDNSRSTRKKNSKQKNPVH